MKKPFLRLVACLTLLALLAAAQPVPAQAAGKFQDVPAGCWAASSIDRAVKLGLFQGETESTFGLGHSMTRAAFVVVLNRLFGWEQVTPATGSYTDNQNPDAWYYSAVETAYRRGAITRQSSTFRPRDPITREEMAVMLVRALGYGSIAGLTQELPMPFTDVKYTDYYYDAVLWAYKNDITTGLTATTFGPNSTVTRGQVVTFLHRALNEPYSGSYNPFTDVKSSDYFADAVLWAYQNDVTTGLTATSFGPNSGCTRGQIVTFLYRAYEGK